MEKAIIIIISIILILFIFLFFLFIQLLKSKIKEYNKISKELQEKQKELVAITSIEEEKQRSIKQINDNIVIFDDAYNNYVEVLELKYKEKEEEWDKNTETLQASYSELQSQLIQETEAYRAELDKVKATRTAAIQALVREKEIEEKLSFYCLQISDKELADVKMLEEIKNKLNNPRVAAMLIWQSFFQKPMNTLCANVLGTKTKCGIYKITNIKTKECYIGQAVNVADRWKQHAKCGLDIDTPAGNKLYKAMKEYGIWNFSWELIEECPSPQLNEKEKYYISLYDSYNYGFNSNKGVG